MTAFLNDLDKKSDEELMAIANGRIPYSLSAKSTTTSQDIIIEAKTILSKRKLLSKKKQWFEKPLGLILIGIIASLLAGLLIYFYALPLP